MKLGLPTVKSLEYIVSQFVFVCREVSTLCETAELHCTKSCVFQIDIKIVNLLNKNRTSFKKMPEIMQYSFG